MGPEALINEFGSRLKALLEDVRPHIEPSEYEEVLNQATDFLATVAVAILASHGYEVVDISIDTDSMSVSVATSDPSTSN